MCFCIRIFCHHTKKVIFQTPISHEFINQNPMVVICTIANEPHKVWVLHHTQHQNFCKKFARSLCSVPVQYLHSYRLNTKHFTRFSQPCEKLKALLDIIKHETYLSNTVYVSFVNVPESTFTHQVIRTVVVCGFTKLCICEYFDIIFHSSKFSYLCVYLSMPAAACNLRSSGYYKNYPFTLFESKDSNIIFHACCSYN